MPIFAILALWSDAMAIPPPIDGTRLRIGEVCYEFPGRAGASRGQVLRRVERLDGKRLLLTVASRFDGGPLLTSRMEVAFPSLRPIRTIEESDGRTSLSVRYGHHEAKGVVTDDDGHRHKGTTPLPEPVWDEETIEFALTTLPFTEGAQFEIPGFHFGRGPAVVRIGVRRSVAFGDGSLTATDAWEVQGSTRSGMTITYVVAKADRRLLGIDAGDVRSVAGGNCSGLVGR
jgi:hypothetical protein